MYTLTIFKYNTTYNVYLAAGGGNGLEKVAAFSYYQAYTLGDVNCDGKILVNDAQMVLNYVVENQELSETQIAAADVVHDGKILVNDAQKILNYIVGNITDFN